MVKKCGNIPVDAGVFFNRFLGLGNKEICPGGAEVIQQNKMKNRRGKL